MRPQSSRLRNKTSALQLECLESREVPAIFTVTSAADDLGLNTLRVAIEQSNASVGVRDRIVFDLAPGSTTIALTAALPTITDAVEIDGTTQSGFDGSPLVEIDGANAGDAYGLNITAGNSVVRGLSITGFAVSTLNFQAAGIRLAENGGNIIEGNWIGLRPDGSVNANNNGVWILSSGNRVGGADASARNVISGNVDGVRIGNLTGFANSNIIIGNYIGTNATGDDVRVDDLPTGNFFTGIVLVNANNNIIGRPGAGNVISGGAGHFDGAIEVIGSSNGNVIQSNLIGLAADGVTVLNNSGPGVAFGDDMLGGTIVANLVGGTGTGEGNVIAGNSVGVFVRNDRTGGFGSGPRITTGVSVLGNSIYDNFNIGILLGNAGVSGGSLSNAPNDAADTDTGANGLQNFPVITSVTNTALNTTITGTLNSKPNTTYRIEFFSNPQGGSLGEGRTFIGATTVTTDDSGNASFNVTFDIAISSTLPITATATAPDGSTSPFSLPSHGVIVTQVVSGLPSSFGTSEKGETVTYSIVLTSKPTADVTITAVSSDPTEGIVSLPLTFTPDNWDTPQLLTITGVNDNIADGTIIYSVALEITSDDSRYQAVSLPDILLLNSDDEVIVVQNSFASTSESGQTGLGATNTFTVSLGTKPDADVTISFVNVDPTEHTLSVNTLTFTPLNWDIPQTVTVTGLDDAEADGTQSYSLTLVAASQDPRFNGLTSTNAVLLSNTDDDLIILSTSALTMTEGESTTITVKLAAPPSPSEQVTVSIFTTGGGFAAVQFLPQMLTFTADNWDEEQTVTVTASDNMFVSGASTVQVQFGATTSGFTALATEYMTITVEEDDPGIIATVEGLESFQTGTTSESGGSVNVLVRLTTAPSENVTIPIMLSDPTEAQIDVTSLTFSPSDWNIPKVVTVTGLNDGDLDGDVSYFLSFGPSTSSDSNYNFKFTSLNLVNRDNEPNVRVSTTSIFTGEDSTFPPFEFTVVLTTQPAVGTEVIVPISSSNLAEGTVSVPFLTFTYENWNIPQSVTVTGVDDDIADFSVAYSIVIGTLVSDDPAYNGINPADISATNSDDDVPQSVQPGIVVTPISGSTTESGGAATFNVSLATAPGVPVTITVTSTNPSEGTVSTSTLTFTPDDWDTPQTVTVTGVDDGIADGNIFYSVQLSLTTTDPAYSFVAVPEIVVQNFDDETAGVVVTPTSLTTTEAGESDTFDVVLTAKPAFDVIVSITHPDATEGSVSTTLLTFTPENWDTPQTVTVTGVDDGVDDDDVTYTIITTVSSADASYDGITVADVTVTNTDDDEPVPGVIVTPTSTTTTEAGGTATFSVVLNSKPDSDVTITLDLPDATEGTISQTTLTFTPENWDTPQTITVTGVDDFIDDGDVTYTITTTATSDDANYDGIAVDDVSVTNTDNDTVGVVMTPIAVTTTEAGGTAAFSVVLSSKPDSDVTITLDLPDATEGTISQTTLTFTPDDWNTPQIVIVTGVDDGIDDGDITYTITTTATSDDNLYNGIAVADVTVINTDDDEPLPGVIVIPTTTTTTEAGGTATFSVVLTTKPDADVTITLDLPDATEGTISQTTLTFTPDNWDVAQIVTVTGVDDDIEDGNVTYTITTTAASDDTDYDGIAVNDVSITNTDNDTAGVIVTPITLTTTEVGGTATFSVVLTSIPTADVTVTLNVSDSSEGSINKTTLTFTAANWNVPQIVTVTGVDDAIDDGNVNYTVTTTVTSSDTVYNGIAAADVSVTNIDNDITIDQPSPPAPPTPTIPVFMPGRPGEFIVTDPQTGEVIGTVTPFGGYTGELVMAAGDINNDGVADYVVGTVTNAGHVKVFDGKTGTLIQSFRPFGGSYFGGVSVAAGDLNGDGYADMIVGAGSGTPGGHVKVFDGATGALVQSFLSFGGYFGGVNVAAGDVDGDGDIDLVVATAASASHVKVFDGTSGAMIRSFLPFGPGYTGGIEITTINVDGDEDDEIVVGSATGPAHVKIFDGRTTKELSSFLAFTGPGVNGAHPFVLDVPGDADDLIVQTGDGRVRYFDAAKPV